MKFKLITPLLMAASLLATHKTLAQCATSSAPTNNCTSYSDMISGFTLNSISATGNSGCGTNGYNYFSSPVWNLTIGQTYNYTITFGNGDPQGTAIWIDLNGNNIFDNSEMLVSNAAVAGSKSGTITIPATATAGSNRRMRVMDAYNNSSIAGSDACTSGLGTWGETEDYQVNLVSPCTAPNITVQPQNRQFCLNGASAFSITATVPSGTITYKWQVNSGSGFTNITDNSIYSGSGTAGLTIANIPGSYSTYQYRCVATASCGTPTNSAAATLTQHPVTNITSQTPTVTTCAGISASASITATGATNHRWQIGSATGGFSDLSDNTTFSGTASSVLSIYQTPDTLAGMILRCIAQGPCNDDTSTGIPLVLLLTPKFLEQPKDITIPVSNNVYFSVSVNANSNPIEYYWQASYDSVNFYNIQKNSVYNKVNDAVLEMLGVSLAQSGLFFRCIIKSTGGNCGDFADTSDVAKLTVTNPSSVNDLNSGTGISVYPNPVTGSDLFIQSDNGFAGEMNVRILDKLGRTLYTGAVDLSQGKATVPVTSLPPGIYTLWLGNKEGQTVQSSLFTKQ